MLAKIKTWAAIAGAVAVAILVAWWKGQSAGKAAAAAKQAEQERRDAKTVNDARANAKGKSDEDLDAEVDQWTRK